MKCEQYGPLAAIKSENDFADSPLIKELISFDDWADLNAAANLMDRAAEKLRRPLSSFQTYEIEAECKARGLECIEHQPEVVA